MISRGIGAVGAALTVTALAMEPFLQQIPSYPARDIVSGTASVPLSVYYLGHVQDSTNSFPILDTSLKGTIYSGIFTPANKSGSQNTPVCPTGECTWPTYSSLGVCSACEDIISTLPFNPNPDYAYTWLLPDPFEVYGSSDTDRVWISLHMGTATYNEIVEGGARPSDDYSYAFKPVQNHTILDMISVYWPPGHVPDPTKAGVESLPSWKKNLYMLPSGVYECILYFCVKTYSAYVHNGSFNESVVSTWPGANETLPRDFPWDPEFPATVNANLTLRPPGNDTAYTVDLLTLDLLRDWAGNTFNGEIGANGDKSHDGGVWGETGDILQAFYDEQTRTLGPNQTLFNYSVPTTAGPKPLLDKIAASMTTYIREIADPKYSATVSAHSVRTVVSARSYWAVFPITLLVLAFGSMVSTVMLNTGRAVPVWKSSSLASLLHGLDETSCQAITARQLDEMEDNAESYTMRIPVKMSRWRLEGTLKWAGQHLKCP